ncbi:MAG TPA: radical SAM family heme chaperone HemW, partial [Dehalococcoidia bacterium]
MRDPASATRARLPLGLYLHLPFCDHKCAYCDFNSYAGLDHLIPAYSDALVRDIVLWRDLAAGSEVVTVFLGGGTPSLTPLPQLERIFGAVRRSFALAEDTEVTLEANPGTVDAPYLRGLRELGVNRLSLGVQSFDDGELRRLDRIHDAAQAIAAYRAARAAGFENVNLDLIFGLEGQSPDGWRANLRIAAELAPEHLSLYGLTVEPGTKLAWQVEHGATPAPDPDLQADMYEAAAELMAAAGYVQYEISNWSRLGRACRHNLIYWRNEPYLGLGAGAHSRFVGQRFAMVRPPAGYIARVATATGGVPAQREPLRSRFPQIGEETAIEPLTDASDTAILGLRLNEGVDLGAFVRRHGARLDDLAGPALADLEA